MRKLSMAAERLEGQKMFQVLAKAQELERQGRNIVHFEIGDPRFDTPKVIVDAASQALRSGDTHYCNSTGLMDFKLASAEVTKRSRGFRPDPNQILVTAGANVQIYYAMACIANPGEEVIMPDPGFVSYGAIAKLLGISAVTVPLRETNEFRMDPDDIGRRITDRTRMIIINSPHNPTGAVLGEDEVRAIYEIAEKNDLYVLSDEVYARMIYKDLETGFYSPSKYDQCKERVLVAHSFSKTYAMTGWRLGAVTGPEKLIARMGLMLETTSSCVSPFIQRAGIAALQGSQTEISQMVEELRKRRDFIVERLNSIPRITCQKPRGAFYAFPNIQKTGLRSEEFSDLMLDKAGVALCPGNYFGEQGEGYVRLCFATSTEDIKRGMERIERTLTQV